MFFTGRQQQGQRFNMIAKNSIKTGDILGIAVFFILLIFGLAPLVGPIYFISFSLDPLYCIMQKVLPDPGERTLLQVFGGYLIRFVTVTIWYVELLRFLSLFSYMIMVTSFVAIAIPSKLKKLKSSGKCFILYSNLRVLFISTWEALSLSMIILALFTKIGTILSMWVVVRYWKLMLKSPGLLMMKVAISVVMVVWSVLVLPLLARISTETKELVQERRITHFSSRNRNTNFRCWLAQQSVDIPCGPFFSFGPEATRDFLNWILNNLASAILLSRRFKLTL